MQARLYRFLTNLIDAKSSFDGIEFVEVRFNQPNIDGFPDWLFMLQRRVSSPIPILVIETKRKASYRSTRFDPWDKNVIAQSERYATWLGAPHFAACNGEILVLFRHLRWVCLFPKAELRITKFLLMKTLLG